MAYNDNIPQPTDFLSNSQSDLLNNFKSANASMAINHYPFNDGTVNNGKHNFLQMPIPGSVPSTAVNELAFFSAVIGGINVFAMREQSNGVVYALTGVTPSIATNGYTPLIGSALIQWGILTNPGTSGSISFATSNIAFSNNCFLVIPALQHNSSANESVTIQPTPSKTGFSYRTTSSSTNTVLYWWAIGN